MATRSSKPKVTVRKAAGKVTAGKSSKPIEAEQATAAQASPPRARQTPSAGGRFREPMDASADALGVSLHFDRKLADADITGSLAHAEMLAAQGILTHLDFQAIREGMATIREELRAGVFPFRPELEDIHMNIEARLTELTGDAGRRLHTGRSRNDQVATDLRLYLRDEVDALVGLLGALRAAFVRVAHGDWQSGRAGVDCGAVRGRAGHPG